ncbi:oligosaccharide flippase family protein [Hafnia paralvei]|uniref:oligosaccharide flippase family protein n=1 Tax=Hafnia paralvei TaxID=546367 RepID=UPI00141A3CFA|nr:oligosaccharide flippase family protein [Hafnia paralvei]NIH31525.1 oligosaccharide flippase family protein [Hafnia paralvei]
MSYKEILKKYSLFSLSPLISSVIQLLSIFVVGHSLNNSELGIAGIYSTLIFILIFASDGGSSSFFLFKKKLSRNSVLKVNFLNLVISFFSIIGFIFYLVNYNAPYLFVSVMMFLGISLFVTVSLYYYSRFLVLNKFNEISVIELSSKIIFITVLVCSIYIFSLGAISIAISWFISYGIRFFLFLIFSRKYELYSVSTADNIVLQWWGYIKNQILSQLINYSILSFDIFFISTFGGLEKVGIYALCKDATLKISSVLSPVISKLFISKIVLIDKKDIKKMYDKVLLVTFLISVSIFGLWAIVGFDLLRFLRPGLNDEAIFYIVAWSLCGVLRMLINPITAIYQGVGDTFKELKINIFSFCIFSIVMAINYFTMNNIVTMVLLSLIIMYVSSLCYSFSLLKKSFVEFKV